MDPNAQPPVQQQEAQPAEQTQPQEAAPPPKKRSVAKIIFSILGILLLLTILGVAGLLYYFQSKGLTLDKVSPEAQPTSTITRANATTNTYKNNTSKFSLSYPKDLDIKESPYGFGVTSVEMSSPETAEKYGPEFQILVFPKALGQAIGQDFDKNYDLPPNSDQEIKDPSGTAVQFTKLENRTVNGHRAFSFKSAAKPIDPETAYEIGVYIEIGNDTVVISTSEGNEEKLENLLKDFKYPL